MNKKCWILTLSVAGGVLVFGSAAIALWNCKQWKTARLAKRAGNIIYRVGSTLQSISTTLTD